MFSEALHRMQADLRSGVLRGILCDLDGVLVDSSASVHRAWDAFIERHELDPAKVHAYVHGRASRESIAALLADRDADVALEVRRHHDAELHDTHDVVAMPGAASLLRGHRRLAVVTSCSAPLAAARMGAAGLPRPTTLISSDRVARGKPDPACYLAAAEALGLRADQCLAIEDSPVGVAAATRAGARVLALCTTSPETALSDADAIVDDLLHARFLPELRG